MSHAILFTQCLQRDFVEPIGRHAPLPNGLHVGRVEAARLLGPVPARGPVAQLAEWARGAPPEALTIIHLRDWHDAEDPAQAEHLERFGAHCRAGTPGAALVAGLEGPPRPNEHLVDCLTLNDFEGTGLADLLAPLLAAGPVRVGVVGVWTDAKVSFLLYELATRCGLTELATCAALTASASRVQHFNALEQLRRLLGVRVFDSVGDFAAWLVPAGPPVAAPALPKGVGPRIGGATLGEADAILAGALFRDSAELSLRPLGGGFSGAAVYRARSRDALGQEQAPTVLKLGPRALIAKEKGAFERVEDVLGNHAPAVRGFVEHGARAGLRYAYAGMGGEEVQPFKALYEGGAPEARVRAVLRTVFDEILGRFYRAARYERLPLLAHYGFAPRHADFVRAQVARLGEDPGAPVLHLGGRPLPNLVRFYSEILPALPADADAGFHQVSFVHGDLNGANILVDERDNVWVIDFFHAARGHVLKDLAKLENDLLYIFTPLDEGTFRQALALSAALRRVRDLRAPLPEAVAGVVDPGLQRAWRTVRLLRSIAGQWVGTDRAPAQLSTALLRYAAHTLSFEESDAWQRRWALASACGHAVDLTEALERRALGVDWLPTGASLGGALGLTLCPGRRDRRRDLDADLDRLEALGVGTLVTLCTTQELEWLGVAALPAEVERRGMAWRHAPIRDQSTPTLAEARALVAELSGLLAAGERVVLHCVGGLGRSGLVAALLLVSGGMGPAAAIGAVRAARDPRALETRGQEAFVERYARALEPGVG